MRLGASFALGDGGRNNRRRPGLSGDGGGDFGRKSEEEEKGRTTRGVDWVDRLGRTGCFDPAGPHSVGAISSFDLGLIENTLNYIVSIFFSMQKYGKFL